MRLAFFGLWVGLFLGPHAGLAKFNSIQIWARVANTSITDRSILIESIIENPSLWSTSALNISIEAQNLSFQRLLIQAMVLEENRIFRSENVTQDEVMRDFRKLERQLGAQFKNFSNYFELNDQKLKEKIFARILLEKSLKSRVKNYAQNLSERDQRRIIEDWISQLRGRYKIQNFRLDKNNPRLKFITGENSGS